MANINLGGFGGIGLAGILFIIFLILKLTGKIDWNWWWVFSPLLISFALSLISRR